MFLDIAAAAPANKQASKRKRNDRRRRCNQHETKRSAIMV